jgi:hypothetical protein
MLEQVLTAGTSVKALSWGFTFGCPPPALGGTGQAGTPAGRLRAIACFTAAMCARS